MIIENVEALKAWLSKLLEPICEADPSALSNYVVALVKKKKPDKDLKALCTDQLEVFLKKETDSFVEKLFESLSTKNYLETPAKDVLAKETKLSGGKHTVEKVGHVEGDRNCQRKTSPLRIHAESRSGDDRARGHHKRRSEHRCRKRGESRRKRHGCSAKKRHSHRHTCSRSRSRSRDKTRSRDRESHRGKERRSEVVEQRKDPENSASVPASSCDPPQRQDQPTPRGSAPPSSVTVVTPAHLPPDSTTESWSGDCSDRGESKPVDKGAEPKQRRHHTDDGGLHAHLCPFDPSMMDEGTLLAAMPLPHPPGTPPTGTAMPTNEQAPQPGSTPTAGSAPTPGNETVEVCVPEAPGAAEPGLAQNQRLIPRVQTLRPGLFGLSSRDLESPSSRAANIIIRVEPSMSPTQDGSSGPNGELEGRMRPLGANEGLLLKKPWMDSNQRKPTFQKSRYGNTKLEVRKIPGDLNNITKLNEHFRAFGTIVNIQVGFGGDAEAALIQFSSSAEARRAIGSTKAVLNNRFIQVHWHRDGPEPELCPPQDTPAGATPHASVRERRSSLGCSLLNETAAKQGGKPAAQHVVSTPSLAMTISVPLQKTACRSHIVSPTSKTDGKVANPLAAQKAMKKKGEALKLQQDMRKVKQKILEKQIECQKVLINRLERAKALKQRERTSIMKTLKELSGKICQLREDVRSANHDTDSQKVLLDAEVDLHKKLVSGEDHADLKKKLKRLQVEASRLGLTPARGKAPFALVRGRGQGRGAQGQGGEGHPVVEHQPQTPAVLGLANEEKAGGVKVGSQAEEFNGNTLKISEHTPETESEPIKLQEDISMKESVSAMLLPQKDHCYYDDDEDEEDKHESRPWRK